MSEFDFGAEYASFGDDLKGVAYEGDFEMLVTKMKHGTSPKGKAMFTVTLAFTSGPLKAKNKTIDDRLYWSPENDTAARIFAQNLRVLGAPQEWIMSDRPTPEQIAERCVGNVVAVKLKKDEFNGQPQTRVNYQKTVKASGGPSVSASSAQAQAATLDDDDEDAAAATSESAVQEPKEPASVGAGATGGSTGGSDPWSDS
jgi:hypothetical protein